MYHFNSSMKTNFKNAIAALAHLPPHHHSTQTLSVSFCLFSIWYVNHMHEFPHQEVRILAPSSSVYFSCVRASLSAILPCCQSVFGVLIPAFLYPSPSNFLQTLLCPSLPSLFCGLPPSLPSRSPGWHALYPVICSLVNSLHLHNPTQMSISQKHQYRMTGLVHLYCRNEILQTR